MCIDFYINRLCKENSDKGLYHNNPNTVQNWSKLTDLVIHTEKCLVVFTIRWLIQLHDLVSYKAATFLVVVTISDICNDLGNTTTWLVTLPIICSYSYY